MKKKSLNVQILAEEYKVNKRTIQRDILNLSEVLPMLDKNENGDYVLPEHYAGQLKFDDVRHFANLVGAKGLLPTLNREFLSQILDDRAKQIYETKGQANENMAELEILLKSLKESILAKHRITVYYKNCYHLIEPYKLILNHSCWYLAAVKEGKLRSYRLSFVENLEIHTNQPSFKHDKSILQQLEQENNIWFGDKHEAILKVSAEKAQHFKKRELLPDQQIIKEMGDGSLLLSSQYVASVQILALIRYWIPYITVVSPESLKQELMDGLKSYIN